VLSPFRSSKWALSTGFHRQSSVSTTSLPIPDTCPGHRNRNVCFGLFKEGKLTVWPHAGTDTTLEATVRSGATRYAGLWSTQMSCGSGLRHVHFAKRSQRRQPGSDWHYSFVIQRTWVRLSVQRTAIVTNVLVLAFNLGPSVLSEHSPEILRPKLWIISYLHVRSKRSTHLILLDLDISNNPEWGVRIMSYRTDEGRYFQYYHSPLFEVWNACNKQ
jgi:hypothetical protein